MSSDRPARLPRPHPRRPVRPRGRQRPGRPDRRASTGPTAVPPRRRTARPPPAAHRPRRAAAGGRPPVPLRRSQPAPAARPSPAVRRRTGDRPAAAAAGPGAPRRRAVARRRSAARTWWRRRDRRVPGLAPGSAAVAAPLRRSAGCVRRLALWGAGADGEYLAWGRPARAARPAARGRPARGAARAAQHAPRSWAARHLPPSGPRSPRDRRVPAARGATARAYGGQRVHHPPGARRHLRHGRLDPLAGLSGGHGRPSRPVATRSTPPSPPGSPCRSSSRTSTAPAARSPSSSPGARRQAGAGAPSSCPVRGSPPPARRSRPIEQLGLDLGPRHRPPRRHRPRRHRRLADPAARPRHPAAGRRPPLRHRVRRARPPSASPGGRDRRLGLRALPHPLAYLGRHLARLRRSSPRRRQPVPQPGPRLDLPPTARRSARTLPRGADRRGARGLVHGVRRRGDRRVRPVPGDGRLRSCRTADSSPGTTSPAGRRRTSRRSPSTGDGWTLAKAGPWSQGPALLQALAMLDGVRRQVPRPGTHRHRRCRPGPRRRRGGEAGDGRP